MGQLSITVNNRNYKIACDDGQEEHLQKLADYFNGRVEELAASIGQVGDARLMLIAGLLVSDELSDAFGEVKTLREEVAALSEKSNGGAIEDEISSLLEGVVDRLEVVAGKINPVDAGN